MSERTLDADKTHRTRSEPRHWIESNHKSEPNLRKDASDKSEPYHQTETLMQE
jgi:hypothetical protein